MPYAEELEWPKANSGPRLRKQSWGYCAAQEFTLISPAMHDEFLLQYQLPILEKFGLIAYGCCENLTHKIALLRKIPNLRIIAAAPTVDLRRCAEQIGTDYVFPGGPIHPRWSAAGGTKRESGADSQDWKQRRLPPHHPSEGY